MSTLAGAALGGICGLGMTCAVYSAPRYRRPRLEARLGPYLRDAPRRSSLLVQLPVSTPFPTLERILRPIMSDAVALLNRVLGGFVSTRRRLEQAGRGMTVDDFRSEQVLWGAIGLMCGVTASLLLLTSDPHRSPVMLLVLCGAAMFGGVVLRDYALTQEVAKREQRMLAEFPTVAEMLALAVGAGEGPVGALERVVRTSKGELAKELATALAEARAGATLVSALENVAARTSLPTLARFVDGIAVAVERGTPLAEVLRAQAVDVREAGKRALLESGGKKEVAMMVPVVFFILPVTMLFALFPGFVSLRLLA
jgi:tight adherence protein C